MGSRDWEPGAKFGRWYLATRTSKVVGKVCRGRTVTSSIPIGLLNTVAAMIAVVSVFFSNTHFKIALAMESRPTNGALAVLIVRDIVHFEIRIVLFFGCSTRSISKLTFPTVQASESTLILRNSVRKFAMRS